MLDLNLLTQISGPPEVSTHAQAWHGHVPFARWLLRQTAPCTFVELGVFLGDSYLTICETILRNRLETRCFGIDTWKGDVHAGGIERGSLDRLKAFHDPRYGEFSTLLQMRFDEALQKFEDASIDLMHIDGLHTYEAVRADYESWLPKMSAQGVILFHDSAVRKDDFGVNRLWSEISSHYPSFEFEHSHGLAVLGTGKALPEAVRWLTGLKEPERDVIKYVFAHMGAAAAAHAALRRGSGAYLVDDHFCDPCELNARVLEFEDETRSKDEAIAALKGYIASLEASTSWRLTAPLRKLADAFRGRSTAK